jgi:hypothetical protein
MTAAENKRRVRAALARLAAKGLVPAGSDHAALAHIARVLAAGPVPTCWRLRWALIERLHRELAAERSVTNNPTAS